MADNTDRAREREKALELRRAAIRLRIGADVIRAAIEHPERHPMPTADDVPGLPTAAHVLAIYARWPHLGLKAIEQYHDLADINESEAGRLLRRTR